jgi:hypothetical protein
MIQKDYALIAQWIERLLAEQKVAGSSPAKRTIYFERACESRSLPYTNIIIPWRGRIAGLVR